MIYVYALIVIPAAWGLSELIFKGIECLIDAMADERRMRAKREEPLRKVMRDATRSDS